jgi:hypothetical protein
VDTRAQVGRLVIAHLGPDIADRELEPREPALRIEDLGAPREEEVESILTPGHVPDEPGDRVEALGPEAHLRLAQPLQEISRHLQMQPLMVQREELKGVHGVPPSMEGSRPSGRRRVTEPPPAPSPLPVRAGRLHRSAPRHRTAS